MYSQKNTLSLQCKVLLPRAKLYQRIPPELQGTEKWQQQLGICPPSERFAINAYSVTIQSLQLFGLQTYTNYIIHWFVYQTLLDMTTP